MYHSSALILHLPLKPISHRENRLCNGPPCSSMGQQEVTGSGGLLLEQFAVCPRSSLLGRKRQLPVIVYDQELMEKAPIHVTAVSVCHSGHMIRKTIPNSD